MFVRWCTLRYLERAVASVLWRPRKTVFPSPSMGAAVCPCLVARCGACIRAPSEAQWWGTWSSSQRARHPGARRQRAMRGRTTVSLQTAGLLEGTTQTVCCPVPTLAVLSNPHQHDRKGRATDGAATPRALFRTGVEARTGKESMSASRSACRAYGSQAAFVGY